MAFLKIMFPGASARIFSLSKTLHWFCHVSPVLLLLWKWCRSKNMAVSYATLVVTRWPHYYNCTTSVSGPIIISCAFLISGDLQNHLYAIFKHLRPQDSIKLVCNVLLDFSWHKCANKILSCKFFTSRKSS